MHFHFTLVQLINNTSYSRVEITKAGTVNARGSSQSTAVGTLVVIDRAAIVRQHTAWFIHLGAIQTSYSRQRQKYSIDRETS